MQDFINTNFTCKKEIYKILLDTLKITCLTIKFYLNCPMLKINKRKKKKMYITIDYSF